MTLLHCRIRSVVVVAATMLFYGSYYAANGFIPTGTNGLRCSAFVAPRTSGSILSPAHDSTSSLQSTTAGGSDYVVADMGQLQKLKSDLIQLCERPTKPTVNEMNAKVRDLETMAEDLGVGQASSHSGLLSGEWELLYSPEDDTRSSPFFWAFRKAFPGEADQIFGITDAIPAPIKEVGPATQVIELDPRSSTECGTLVSKVKVATLGGVATSMMTTRATIVGVEGLEGLRLRIDTTKPEESTILKTLGPLGDAIATNAPAFPSGQALEKARMGSSEVGMVTTFCDETLRISRNEDSIEDAYVWRRLSFRGVSEI